MAPARPGRGCSRAFGRKLKAWELSAGVSFAQKQTTHQGRHKKDRAPSSQGHEPGTVKIRRKPGTSAYCRGRHKINACEHWGVYAQMASESYSSDNHHPKGREN